MDQIILKLDGEKVTSYTVWNQMTTKDSYSITKVLNGKTYGMVGTQTGLTNFDEVHKEVIQTIQKSYPETRKGQIKFCAIEVEK